MPYSHQVGICWKAINMIMRRCRWWEGKYLFKNWRFPSFVGDDGGGHDNDGEGHHDNDDDDDQDEDVQDHDDDEDDQNDKYRKKTFFGARPPSLSTLRPCSPNLT